MPVFSPVVLTVDFFPVCILLVRTRNHVIKRVQITVLKSRFQRVIANVAQLVEQLIRNQQVTGSNPVVGSILK